MKYIIREDNIPVLSANYVDEILDEKLKRDYSYIHDSMEVEGYRIRFNDFSMFSEILFDAKVVGFITFIHDEGSNMGLNEVFILPEFRHNGLFLQGVLTLFMSGADLSFNEPTRNLVEILIHMGLAERLNDGLVASAVGFDISDEHMIYHGEFDVDEIISTHLYDTNLCSPVYLHDISTPGVCQIAYQDALDWDDMHYDCRRFRKSTDLDEYFNSIKNALLKNSDEYAEILKMLKYKLPRGLLNYETIFGDDDDLSDYMVSLIDGEVVDEDEASRIIRRLKEEYDEGIVSDEGLLTRLGYLIDGTDLSQIDELFLENISRTTDLCPCCRQPVSRSDSYCVTCGCDISDGDLLDYEEVMAEIVQANDNVIDLRGQDTGRYLDTGDIPLSGDDEIFDMLYEIYEKNDTEAFEELKKVYPFEITDITEIADLEDRTVIDLSSFFLDEDVTYMKNYHSSCRIVDRMKPRRLHRLRETDDLKNPTYSVRMALLELKGNPNLEGALESADIRICGDEVKRLLFENDLIESRTFGEDFWLHVYQNYLVVELKEILRKNSLKVSGNKLELALRLRDNDMYHEFGEDEFQLTENGEFLLAATQWIEIYDEFMDDFDLDDIQNYLKGKSGNFMQNAMGYLDEHIKIGYRRGDFGRLHDAFSSKAMLHVYWEDFKGALVEELKLFMLRINPIYLSVDDLESYEAIMFSNLNNIIVLMHMTNTHNLKKMFNRTWGLMKFEKRLLAKKVSLRYLVRALDGEDFDELSHEIADRYFRN